MDDRYVPILTGGRAEVAALGSLPGGCLGVVPLFDLPPLRRARPPTKAEVAAGAPPPEPETLATATAKFVRALGNHWQPGQRFYLDLNRIRRRRDIPLDPTEFVFAQIRQHDLRPSPCLGMRADAAEIRAAAEAFEAADGLALRVDARRPAADIREWIAAILARTGATSALTTVVLDYGRVESDDPAIADEAARLVRDVRGMGDWWLVAVAWTSAPQMGTIPTSYEPVRLARVEPRLWERLRRALGRATPAYSDYGVTGPTRDSDDPAWGANPNLRYTLDDAWLVWKGAKPRRRLPGEPRLPDLQFNRFCRRLIEIGAHAGRSLSPGDEMIEEYAMRGDKGGNPSTWIEISTSHHLALARRALEA